MTDSEKTFLEEFERDYVENENKDKAMVLSILHAIQELVLASTTDPRHIVRCNEICDAVMAFAFTNRREPLEPMTASLPSRNRDA